MPKEPRPIRGTRLSTKENPRSQSKAANAKTLGIFGVHELISLAGFCLVTTLFIASYFGRNVLSLFIFAPNDGWCLENEPGIGIHCFGDFGAVLASTAKGFDGFYAGESVVQSYPPLNFYIYKAFHILATISSYRISLVVFLIFLIAALLTPAMLSLTRSENSTVRNILISLGTLTFLPFIMTLDRGNSLGLAIPLLFVYLYPRNKLGEFKKTLVLILLVNLKPQFILLMFLEFRRITWQLKFQKLFLVTSSYLLLFLVGSPRNTFTNIISFLNAIRDYGNLDLSRQFPYNYSFGQGIYNIFSNAFGVKLSSSYTSTFALILSATSLSLFIWKKAVNTEEIRIVLLIPLIFLIPGLSFAYYSVILMVLVLNNKNIFTLEFPRSIGGQVTQKLFIGSLLLTILPLYIGNDLLGTGDNDLNAVQIFLPSAWVVTYMFMAVSATKAFLKELTRKPKAKSNP
jgi:hypothetical protein